MDNNGDIPLNKPTFTSKIPPHLTKNISPEMKFVVESLSIVDQQNEWLINATVNTDTQVRKTNKRVGVLENDVTALKTWKTRMCQSWITLTIVGVFASGLMGVLLTAILIFKNSH